MKSRQELWDEPLMCTDIRPLPEASRGEENPSNSSGQLPFFISSRFSSYKHTSSSPFVVLFLIYLLNEIWLIATVIRPTSRTESFHPLCCSSGVLGFKRPLNNRPEMSVMWSGNILTRIDWSSECHEREKRKKPEWNTTPVRITSRGNWISWLCKTQSSCWLQRFRRNLRFLPDSLSMFRQAAVIVA